MTLQAVGKRVMISELRDTEKYFPFVLQAVSHLLHSVWLVEGTCSRPSLGHDRGGRWEEGRAQRVEQKKCPELVDGHR